MDANRGWADGPVHTEDGGATWVAQSSGSAQTLTNVLFIDAAHGWAIGIRDGPSTVVLTTDGGATWTPSSTGTGVNGDFSFIDTETGWAAGVDEDFVPTIFGTKDGGMTWTPLGRLPGVFAFQLRFVDPLNGWALGIVQSAEPAPMGFPWVVVHTTDGGLTWTEQLRTSGGVFHAMDFVNATTGWVSRSRFNSDRGEVNDGVLFTSDGGATWTAQTFSAFSERDYLTALHFVSPTQGWGVGGGGSIIHTEDGGQSWVPQYTSGGLPFRDVHFVDAKVGWAINVNGTLVKTTTGGKAP